MSTKTTGKELMTKNFELGKMGDMSHMAKTLKTYVVSQNLYSNIAGRNYAHVEGWQVAGAMLGLVPRVVAITNLSKDKEIKWQAEVEILDKNDRVVSRGFAVCSNAESKKKSFDEYAVLSMAQTRAVGKAYRNLIGWIMKLAGYEGTPSEEMKKVGEDQPAPASNEPVIQMGDAPNQKLEKGQVIGPDGRPTWVCEVDGDPIDTAVANYSLKVYKKRLCREHQKSAKKK